MQALFEGRCGKCSRSVHVGQEIRKRGSAWVHARCPASDEENDHMPFLPISEAVLEELMRALRHPDPTRAALYAARVMAPHLPRNRKRSA